MASATGDRNLLFGILALQMDFIGRDALVRAMHAWVLDKAKPLGQILVEQQALGSERRALLEALVQEHVKQHGDDAEKSLASVSSVGSVREELQQIADPDVQASLSHIPPTAGPCSTGPYSVGAPSVVGRRFRVLRPHAEGGLGKVSVARDEELHREVALKEIKERHADHPESRTRFLIEAEITGGLEHPGVVPVYGLGSYEDGRPFYAMRFIRGDSLKDAIKRFQQIKGPLTVGPRALELRQLLSRFNAVCNAVAYAHSRGVLHRDLKPGNVMLGKYGETLVVDWGLAKPLGGPANGEGQSEAPLRPASAGDSAPTQYGQAIGTPAYMAPEQATGRLDQLGPASDVYSLGATLYCLLTGKAPFDRGDGDGVLQRVQRGDFPRPRQVRRDVPRPLEAICLKAMALRPEDRYATPKALAEDVERWLADEPTTAYQEPWGVRARRWVKRHRTPVTATTAAAVAALALGSVLLWTFLAQRWELARETTAELDAVRDLREQDRFEEARAAMARMDHLLSRGDPAGLADRAQQARKDLQMAAELDETPLLAAVSGREGNYDWEAVVQRYGELFKGYGIDMAALDPAEAAWRVRASELHERMIVALDFWASRLPAQDGERARLIETAGRADGDEGRKEQRAGWSQGDRQALERRLDGQDPSSLPPTTAVAVAWVLNREGSAPRTEQLLRVVQQVHPNDFWVNQVLCETLSKAPSRREEALGFMRAAVVVKPDSPGAHVTLGNLLYQTGRREEAEREYRRAIQIKDDLALAHYNLGVLLKDQGKFDEALLHFQRAMELLPPADANRGIMQHNLSGCRRLRELDEKLPAVLKGDIQPKAPEKVEFAFLCQQYKGRYAAASRFYEEAFAEQPALADELKTGARYNAACAAALTAAGQGEGADKLDDKEHAHLRQEALGWLRADLAAWGKQAESGNPQERATVQKTLHHWQEDSDLAGVRDAAALEKLPEADQADWKKLWADVDALRKKTGDGGQK